MRVHAYTIVTSMCKRPWELCIMNANEYKFTIVEGGGGNQMHSHADPHSFCVGLHV